MAKIPSGEGGRMVVCLCTFTLLLCRMVLVSFEKSAVKEIVLNGSF